MSGKNKTCLAILFLLLVSVFLWWTYLNLYSHEYLRFSDAAKFADIARNIVRGNGFVSNFSFFSKTIFRHAKGNFFSVRGVPLAMPYSIAFIFNLLGIADMSVMYTSGIFYLGLVIATYLLAKHLYGNLAGILSAIAVAAHPGFLDYATSGASEVLFSLISVLAAFFALQRKKWADILFFIALILLYLTRPQGFLFIGAFLLMWFSIRLSFKKAILLLVSFVVGAYIVDKKILYPLSWKTNVYPIFTRGLQAFFQYSSSYAVSDALRGGIARNVDLFGLFKKAAYNLYNFYKMLPEIASPYMWGLFLVGLFKWGSNRVKNLFKLSVVFLTSANFLLVALTIPFFRYLHPAIPFVYIIACATLVWIVREIIAKSWSSIEKYKPKVFKRTHTLYFSAGLLIFLFVLGQTLGMIFLDSRFKATTVNEDKQPVYVRLAEVLRENTQQSSLVVTNLDTWGTWYGDRKTVWFPLEPEMLDYKEFKDANFGAIYLTSYLMNDENYYMGSEWRSVFNNPNDPSKWDEYIEKNYKLKNTYTIEAKDDYENQDATAILLVRKTD